MRKLPGSRLKLKHQNGRIVENTHGKEKGTRYRPSLGPVVKHYLTKLQVLAQANEGNKREPGNL